MVKRELKIRKARESFWDFCQATDPLFYLDDREHLKIICKALQGIVEGTILRENGEPYRRLMLNIPPRFGKTRTLVNFYKWRYGCKQNERIISCGYSDEMATDSSRFTRDGISEKKTFPYEIDYSDIFPTVRLSKDNAGVKQWALEGQFFSFKASGAGGSITGKGASLAVVDDAVKDAETAFNDMALDKIWRWYTGTFLSRLEEGAVEIVNMTRWAKGDICGRILDGVEADTWLVIKMKAEADDGSMLCESLLSKASYESRRANMDANIFRANYQQDPVDIEGVLYRNFITYQPRDIVDAEGKNIFDKVIGYCDTADTGSDYLCEIVGGVVGKDIYVTGVYYSKESAETTELETARLLDDNNVNVGKFESNAGGRAFARNVERILSEKFRGNRTSIKWFHQSKNKQARILSNSAWVLDHVRFPHGWNLKWAKFYEDLTGYKKEGRNRNDDAPDTLTGLAEMVGENRSLVAVE